MRKKTEKMPLGYKLMWILFTAAYLVWTCGFLRYDTYPLSETGMLKPWYYPVWIAVSAAFLLSFIGYIDKYLYGNIGKGAKAFALIWLITGFIFITGYCFLKNPLEYTASMTGLYYPWHFKLWGIFSTVAFFANTMYTYRRFDYYNRAGIIAGSIGCAALYVTINVPSAGEDLILNSLRCMSHWSGALIFAFGMAAPMVMFLIHEARTGNKRVMLLGIAFCVILALSFTLLVVVGKDGIIEGVPTWAMFIVTFLLNYTHIFDRKEVKAKEAAHA